jgi:hypothetical protein
MKAIIVTALLAGLASAASATEYTNFVDPAPSSGPVEPALLIPVIVGGEATEFAIPAGSSAEFMRVNASAALRWSIDVHA